MDASAPAPNLALLAGGPLIGYMLNWALFGVLCVQVYWYYLAFPKEKWPSKSLVLFILLIETAQTLVMTSDCWNVYVKGFGDVNSLNNVLNEWLAVPIFTAIVSCTAQIFYAYRLYLLSSRSSFIWPIIGFIFALALLQLVGAIVTSVQDAQIGHWADLDAHFHINEALWLGGTALCDVTIAASMVYYLLARRGSAIRTTRTLVNKLVRLIIETGTLTAVIALLALGLFYGFPDKTMHAAAFNILAKTYSNSVLAIFNNRICIVGGREVLMEEEKKLHISLRPRTEVGPSIDGSQTAKSELSNTHGREVTFLSKGSDDLTEKYFSSEHSQGMA